METLQTEQERLRLKTECLRKQETLRIKQLDEENRKKLAEATFAQLEPRAHLSHFQSEFQNTSTTVD